MVPPDDRWVFWCVLSRDCFAPRRLHIIMIAAAKAPATAPGKKPAATAAPGN